MRGSRVAGFKMHVNTRLANARLKKAEKKIESQGFTSMVDVKTLGMEYLRSIVPYDTGEIYRSIEGNVATKAGGPRVKIEFKGSDDYKNRTPSERFPTFNLVRYAASGSGRKHFTRSGDSRWMKRTRTYLQSKVGDKVKNDYKKLRL